MLASLHTVKSKTDIKSPTHYPCGIARTSESYVSIHSKDGNLARANIKQALGSLSVTPTLVLYEIIALSGETKITKVMKIFFGQQIAKYKAFTKYIFDKIANVKASLRRVCTSIHEMESKSDKHAWTDAIDCFKETKMANLSEDIQCAGSDTRPPMLYKIDFASWKQCIRLYCWGKENGVNILKSIDEGPFQMRIFWEALVEGTEGAFHLGQGNNSRGEGVGGYGGVQNRVGNANPGQARQIKCYNCNGIGHIARKCTQLKRLQNFNYFKDKMLLMQAQENGVALDEEQLLFLAGGQDNAIDEDVDEQPVQDLALNVDNVFQADDCDVFDSNVDEAPTKQTMFMVNLSSTDLVYDKVGPSYDLNILSEVHDHDHYQDAVCEHHKEHEMHDTAKPCVQSNVSSIPNYAYMMIYKDMYKLHAQSVSKASQNTVVDNSLTAELTTYKEQVELYERRARFKFTEREQKIDEQLRIVFTDRIFKEETLKKELHCVKLQLASTIKHNKSMVVEVT
nr:retrovirus-related Pol polyprotein from transposon TNT 1-94 [Tanacetum cinerariifolium]